MGRSSWSTGSAVVVRWVNAVVGGQWCALHLRFTTAYEINSADGATPWSVLTAR